MKTIIYNKKIFFKLIPIVFLILAIVLFLIYKNQNKKEKEDLSVKSDMGAEENFLVIKTADIYQKIAIPSGEISQPNFIEREDLEDFEGLPDKNIDKQFFENQSLIYSEDRNKFLVVSFLGQGENSDKQKEFICNIAEKKCERTEILFNDYKLGELSIESPSVVWLGWNAKSNIVIGLKTDDVNNGTLYVCNIDKKSCNTNTQDKLNFPPGALNSDMTKIAAVKQNDIVNERTGDQWELFLYDLSDLSKPLKSFDISSAIDKNDDLIYDGVNSMVWSDDSKIILLGTLRNIFKFDLESEKLDKIFADIPAGEDDLYWNSNNIKLSDDNRYTLFIDTIEENISKEADDEEDSDFEEGVLKAIDLRDNNKIIELFQAEDLILK